MNNDLNDALQFAYETWSSIDPETDHEKRQLAWDHYCDMRDRLTPGTTRTRRLKIEKRRLQFHDRSKIFTST